jgi:hypothetical protein
MRNIISTLRIIFTVTIFLGCASTNIASSDISSKNEEVPKDFNGYMWEQLPKIMQELFLVGYLKGFYSGYAEGEMEGTLEGQKNLLEFIKNNKVCEGSYSSIKAYSELSALNAGITFVDKLNEKFFTTTDTDFYRKEIVAFYQTYPLCKSQNFWVMLREFLRVWDKNTETSYKEIGNKCLEKKKTN